jgi:hypothetical protein
MLKIDWINNNYLNVQDIQTVNEFNNTIISMFSPKNDEVIVVTDYYGKLSLIYYKTLSFLSHQVFTLNTTAAFVNKIQTLGVSKNNNIYACSFN